MTPNPASERTIVLLTRAILETLEEEPQGGPSSSIYLALQTLGIDIGTYNIFIGSLERLGLIHVSSHWITLTPKGKEWLADQSTKLSPAPTV